MNINIENLQFIVEQMKERDDRKSSEKIQDLIGKWQDKRLTVAFCGHFSAGKSSMINSLVGIQVLPSSPIPTSANLVLIEKGEPKALAYRVDGGKESFALTEAGLASLKTYCADGQAVEKVKISVESDFLPEGVALMDTPGIDSTDDAHRLVTESTLHLADIVFYVVDYNHVQSELNFQFTKQLLDHGKTVYLIVNQIDKHFDLEMDFLTYRESVQEAFALWGIALAGIYFTSLMEPDHLENEYEQLKQDMAFMFEQTEQILSSSIRASANSIITEHIQNVRANSLEQLEEWKQTISQTDESISGADVSSDISLKLRNIESELERLKSLPEQVEEDFLKKMDSLLSNAPLTPYQTIEHIESFLESRQAKFRVGLLGSKTKTEQERESRLQALLSDVQNRMLSAIEWHLKQLFTQTFQDYQITSESLTGRLQDDLHVELESERLLRLVNPGAALEGAYVHTYARDVSSSIKSSYKQLAVPILQELVERIHTQLQATIERLSQEQMEVSKFLQASEYLNQFENRIEAYQEQLREQLRQCV